MPPKANPKMKAADKEAQAEEARNAKALAQKEKEDAASWAVGAKSSSKAKEAEDKDAEKRQKAAEKAALLAAEEAELGNIVRTVKTKKVGKDDFDILNASLAKQPKTKAQKDAEAKKAADEERKKKEAEARELKEAKRKADEEYARKAAAKGVILNHTDDLFVPINNHLEEDELEATGLDAAVDALTDAVKGQATVSDHPEKRRKVS